MADTPRSHLYLVVSVISHDDLMVGIAILILEVTEAHAAAASYTWCSRHLPDPSSQDPKVKYLLPDTF